ncbi:MAG: choice-of-anchor D domain-containing protein [Acidobacteriaceae bacterium]
MTRTNALSSAQQTLNVTNCGNAALDFSSLTSSVSSVTASQSCGSVAPGATCAISFTFAPIDDQASSGTVSLADNTAISPQSIQVSGQGVAPDLEPQSNPFSFGHLLEGVAGPTQSLVVQNNGNANLNISSIAISGTGFSIANNTCANTVTPGGQCYVAMIFSPPSAGAFTGSLTLASNDPVHPTLVVSLTGTGDSAYALPTIVEANGTTNQVPLPTMQINNGSVTLSLVGTNFYPQSVVQFNGVPQQSAWVSNTSMLATIAASSLTQVGEFPLTVVNPSPGGGSVATTITTYDVLPINPNFLTSVAATGLLYAAMPSSDPTNPNTVLPINPKSGATGTPIPVGKNPVLLAPSSDGSYLYVANAADLTVQRINLSTNAVDETFPFPPDPDCSGCTLPPATDLKSVPGAPDEVILGQGAEGSLYNSNGLVNYLPATANYTALAPSFDSMTFAGNPVTLYSLGFYPSTDPFFTTVQITSAGLAFTPPAGSYSGPVPPVGNSVVSDGTLLYTDAGGVWSPATQSQIGSFTTNNFYDAQGDLAIDTTHGRLYLTGDSQFTSPTSYVYDSIAVFAYGLKSLTGTDTLTFPQINASENYDLTRWGTDGFAFLVSPIFSGTGGIYLFTSTALAGVAQPNPSPALTSIAPASVTAGSPAQLLTLTGTGFVAASVVNWNGNPLATSYVSGNEITASIPDSDLATVGSAQVTVVNPAPGGGTSSAQTFTINPGAPAAVLSGTTLSFGSVTEGTSSAAQSVTLTNSGTAALSITSIAASGNFSESNACGSSLAIGANCQISITFVPASAAPLTGTLTITDNAPSSPQTVSLSGTGVAAFSLGTASGGSTSATVSSGGTATWNLAITGAAGFSGSVALGCSGAPKYATCTVSPASANLTSGSSANFTVTVTTTGSSSAAVAHDSALRLAGIGVTALLLVPFLVRLRKRRFQGVLLLAMLGLLLTISGCGGGSNQTTPPPQVTPPGTYTLTVTATASGITSQQSLTLIVQ